MNIDNLNPAEAAKVAKLDVIIRKATAQRRQIKQGANHRAFRERRRSGNDMTKMAYGDKSSYGLGRDVS